MAHCDWLVEMTYKCYKCRPTELYLGQSGDLIPLPVAVFYTVD